MLATRKEIRLHPAQAAFRRSDALYRGFVGGRGAGKSWIGAYDLIRRAKPERTYLVAAPTYPMLRDSSIQSFIGIARDLGFLLSFAKGELIATLGNHARILFRSTDNPDRLRGPNLSGGWFDEAGDMDEQAYMIAIACLREAGDQGWLSATFTPRGRQHWTYTVFGAGKPNTELFTARTGDNPFNPAGFEAQLRQQYTSAFAEQELAGQFIDLAGTVAKREWFRVVDEAPACQQVIRAWDFASTPEDGKGKGDYTAGVLMGLHGDGWVILDVVRRRVAGGSVAGLIKAVAEQDGRGVRVVIEQEPGSSGSITASYLTRELAGWPVTRVKPSSDKLTRALPMLAQAEAGSVAMRRGAWNADFLDEIAAFPGGAHDDQVDATAHAFNSLSRPRSSVADW